MNELPCPCGSGTRHDACCGPIRRSATERYTDDDLRQALALATREVTRPELAEWRSTADVEFFDSWLDVFHDLDPDADEDIDLHEAHSIAFSTWLLFDRELEDGNRPIELLLERRGDKLLPGVRNALRALSASYVLLYRVLAIHTGRGFVVESLASAERTWISEPTAGETEDVGDVVLARVLRDGRGARCFFTDARNFPGGWAEELGREVDRMRELATDLPTGDVAAFWKHIGPELHELWCNWIHGEEDQAEDGTGVELRRTTYRILDHEACTELLYESREFHSIEEDEWEWYDKKGDAGLAHGSLKLEGEELYLVTIHPDVHARARAAAETYLAGTIEHVITETIDLARELATGDERGE